MRIWIDLTNSPHAMLFAPIVERLKARGDTVLVTVRRFAHTVELASERFTDPVVVGRGEPQSLPRKVSALGERVSRLTKVARKFDPDVAVSHGSYDQVVTARLLGIPSLVSVDYEFQPANHLSFRLASRLLLPEAFASHDIAKRGGSRKVWRYKGLKEESYLSGFTPSNEARSRLGLDGDSNVIVALRPSPGGALYHRGENPLFDRLLEKLRNRRDTTTLVVPRHPSHVDRLVSSLEGGGIRVSREVVDGPSLIWWSDLMISGGGTMNREAVVLGTPTWSLFGGRLGAVDKRLIEDGWLRPLHSEDDLDKLSPVKRDRNRRPWSDHDVVTQFVSAIAETARAR